MVTVTGIKYPVGSDLREKGLILACSSRIQVLPGQEVKVLELEAAGQSYPPSGTEKGECVLRVPSLLPLTQFRAPSRSSPVPWVRIPT